MNSAQYLNRKVAAIQNSKRVTSPIEVNELSEKTIQISSNSSKVVPSQKYNNKVIAKIVAKNIEQKIQTAPYSDEEYSVTITEPRKNHLKNSSSMRETLVQKRQLITPGQPLKKNRQFQKNLKNKLASQFQNPSMPALQKLSKKGDHLIPKFQNFPNNSTNLIQKKRDKEPAEISINLHQTTKSMQKIVQPNLQQNKPVKRPTVQSSHSYESMGLPLQNKLGRGSVGGDRLNTSQNICDEDGGEVQTKIKKTHRISKLISGMEEEHKRVLPMDLIQARSQSRKQKILQQVLASKTTRDSHKQGKTQRTVFENAKKELRGKQKDATPNQFKGNSYGQKNFVSPFSVFVPGEKLQQFHQKMLGQQKNTMNDSVSNENNFGTVEDEEHSFGVTLDAEATPQMAHTSLDNNKSVGLSSNIDDNGSIPQVQDSLQKLSIKQSIEHSSRNSISERSHSPSYGRAPKKHTQMSREKEPQRSHRFKGPASQRSEWSQSRMSATENDQRQAVERTKVISQLSKHSETMRTAVRRGRATRGESKVIVLAEEKQISPEPQNLSKVEGVLSMRLTNIKVLSPNLRNNRLSEIPDEMTLQGNLRELKLDYNFLSQLPENVHKLRSLTYLSVSQNNFKVIPQRLLSLSGLTHLVMNDNKISQIQSKIGNLINLKTLFLHHNFIVDVPSSMYKLLKLEQFSLDWFSYLFNDTMQFQTKVLKGKTDNLDSSQLFEQQEEAKRHQALIQQFIDMCKLSQIIELKGYLEQRQQVLHQNPQQDDFEQPRSYENFSYREVSTISMPKGVTSKRRGGKNNKQEVIDILASQKSIRINFMKFLMFFQRQTQVDLMIMRPIFPSKQRKLSHVISMQGHHYLLKDMLKQIDLYNYNCTHNRMNSATSADIPVKQLQTKYQFLNSIDRDFSTPLILALKNKRQNIIVELLDQHRICLKQSSMKYGSAIHVSLQNEEFKISIRLLRMMKQVKDIDYEQDLNKVDEDGNTPMHVLMKVFAVDCFQARKIAVSLIKKGASLKYRNKNLHSPLHMALYYGQNEAVKFAINHNQKIKRNDQGAPAFDFEELGGKQQFTPLHYAVYQNNFQLLFLLLKSGEPINHEKRDAQGRRAIDLCSSISAIFKALRREITKQRYKQLLKNYQSLSQVNLSHQQLVKNINITHSHINARENAKTYFDVASKQNPSTFGSRNMSLQPIFHSKIKQFSEQQNKKLPQISIQGISGESDIPKTLPGAFNRKISHQQQLSQPGLLTGGLAFSRAKDQMTQNSFNRHKNSVQAPIHQYISFQEQHKKQVSELYHQVEDTTLENNDTSIKMRSTDNSFLKRKRSVDEIFNDSGKHTQRYTQQAPLTYRSQLNNSQQIYKNRLSPDPNDKMKSINQIRCELETSAEKDFLNHSLRQRNHMDSSQELSFLQGVTRNKPQMGIQVPKQSDSERESSSSSFRDNVSRDPTQVQESEFEDENVSEDDQDMYESNGSPTISGFTSSHFDRGFKNSFMEIQSRNQSSQEQNNYTRIEDFKDSDHLVEHILTQHKITNLKDQLDLLERINDSIQGKYIANFVPKPKSIGDVRMRESIKPALKGLVPEIKNTSMDDMADFSDISDDCIHDLTLKQKGFSDIKDLNEEDQEQGIFPIQNTKQQAVLMNQQDSVDLSKLVPTLNLGMTNKSDSEEETSIQMPGSQIRENPTGMADSTFGQRRRSFNYLNHNLNYQQQALTQRIRMKSQLSGNEVCTITTNRSFSENSLKNKSNERCQVNMDQLVKKQVPLNLMSSRKSEMEMSDQQMSNIIRLTHVIENANRQEIFGLVDQITLEKHNIKTRGQILQYQGYIKIALQKILKSKAVFLAQIAYDLENIQSELNTKLPKDVKKQQMFANFPIKDRYSSTFRQTMRSRPEILQTNKPAQGLALSIIDPGSAQKNNDDHHFKSVQIEPQKSKKTAMGKQRK